jgi:hypothetical protein
VLYLPPRAWTDRTLELQVSPQPDQVVRVMVGRAELITPSVERNLREQVLTSGSDGSSMPRLRWSWVRGRTDRSRSRWTS